MEIHSTLYSFPGTVEECFEFGWRVFDAIRKISNTCIWIESDLDLGMNRWACHGFEYPDEPMDRGKVVLTKEQLIQSKTMAVTRC
jgi:2-oxoglutarate ferredoxin oxidoreductase subunit alpha